MRFRMDAIRAAAEAEITRRGTLTPADREREDEEVRADKAAMIAALATFQTAEATKRPT